jgi:type II secretory pathway predicted ATPase ExeA
MSDDLSVPAGANGDGVESFFQRVASVNPFLDNRVNGPSAHDIDVEALYHPAFTRLTELAGEALANRRGVGAVLWGEAGVGKSHLLSRLGRWAHHDNRACFVYLHNLQAAPEHLPHSLLHAVVSLLTFGRERRLTDTPLFELVRGGLVEAVASSAGPYPWPQLERAWNALVDGLARIDLPGATPVDRTVYGVLFRLYRSANRAARAKEDGALATLAVRWLSGRALDPDEARALGLPPAPRAGEPVALADAQQIKQVLVALMRLAAGQKRPFVLAFDQVDNLDEDQAGALARFLQALIDSSPNLLVVTAGVKETLLRWLEQRVIQQSAWERLAQIEVTLQRLPAAEALRIVEARLNGFLRPFADLEPVRKRREEDALFPLGAAWCDRYFRDRIEVRPRDAVNWAREGWQRQQQALAEQGGPAWLAAWPQAAPVLVDDGFVSEPTAEEVRRAVDAMVEERLAAVAAELLQEPGSLPPNADHLAGVVYALLTQCRDAGHRYGVWEVERLPAARRGARPTYDLSIRQRAAGGAETQTGVVFVTETSANSVTGFLRRLLEDPRPLDRVVLVNDERIGLPLGGRGREHLDDLLHGGTHRFRRVELSMIQYAELEAMQRLVGLARSRDLEIELPPGRHRTVTDGEVIDSYHRHRRYLASHLLCAVLDWTEETAAAAAPGTS